MALDTIIINGDQVVFTPLFGSAIVSVQPGIMEGTGETTIKGESVCIEGDEKNVEIPNCSYIVPPFVIPGMGTLKIQQLAPNQVTQKVTSGGNGVIVRGGTFIAVFEVSSQAKQPPPSSAPDPMPKHMGQGQFIPTNTKIKAD
jgi:hypothetical protein